MICILWPVSKIMFQTVHWMSLGNFVPTARGLMPKWKSTPVDRKTFYRCTWLWGATLYPLPYHFNEADPSRVVSKFDNAIKCLVNACENKTNSAKVARWRPTDHWVTPQRCCHFLFQKGNGTELILRDICRWVEVPHLFRKCSLTPGQSGHLIRHDDSLAATVYADSPPFQKVRGDHCSSVSTGILGSDLT